MQSAKFVKITVDDVKSPASLSRSPERFSNRIPSPPETFIVPSETFPAEFELEEATIALSDLIARAEVFDLAKENLDVLGLKLDNFPSNSRICYPSSASLF
jgi:hypothetical protein